MNSTTNSKNQSLWASRDYLLWWGGNIASLTGNQFARVAMPLMVLLLTESPFQAGLVASFGTLPYIVLSLPVGVLVDRIPRRPLLIGASLVSMLAFSAIPLASLTGNLTIVLLYFVAFVNGCATVVFSIAQQAVIPLLVADKHLGKAAGHVESIERLAAILGPPVATIVFYELWSSAPFAIDALSFAAIAVAFVYIRTHLGPVPQPPSDEPVRDKMLAGARSLFGNRLLRDLTLLNSAGDLLFAGIGLLMIIIVRDSAQQSVSVGLVFSCAAIGGLLGSLVTNRLEQWIGLSTAVIGKHILTAALFPLLLLPLPAIVVGLVWASISFQVSIVGVIQRKHVLISTPDGLMGRVQSFTTFLSFGSLPLGTAATGFILDVGGARNAVIVYTAALGMLALWSVVSTPIRTAKLVKET